MTGQPDPDALAVGVLTGEAVATAQAMTLRQPCNAAAPLVVNGQTFVGCVGEAGHDGRHTVTVTWGNR